jgi:hypothetical protein
MPDKTKVGIVYLDVWIRVKNLLDEDYTEGGYAMPG